MLGKKGFFFVLFLVLGTSSAGRYVEDSSEHQHADPEKADEKEADRDMDDEDDGKYNRDDDEEDKKEEVVKMQPGQSDEVEQDDGNSENEGDEFEDQGDTNDEHMIEGDEGGRSLADHAEDAQNAASQGGFENFKKTADEIAQENEQIQTEIRDLQGKFEKALSSDIDKAASDPGSDAKAHIEGQQDASDSVQSLKKAISDVSSKARAVQNDDNLIKGFTEIGEDANVEPDDDY